MDDHGKARGAFEVAPDGMARVVLFDENGRTRGIFVVAGDGALVAFYDKNTRTRASLGMVPDGSVSLSLCDVREKPRVVAAVKSDGIPGIVVADRDGRAVWSAP